MAFRFKWGDFKPEYIEEIRILLSKALQKNAEKLPENIVGEIKVSDLHFGEKAPILEILEVTDLDEEKFKAIFKMTYDGNLRLVFQTKVQANPVPEYEHDLPTFPRIEMVAAGLPLIVPMFLKISEVKLNGIIVLSVSKRGGVTLVFKNNPMVSVKVESSFASFKSVEREIQRNIEKVLEKLFEEDLPKIVHEMSRKSLNTDMEDLETLVEKDMQDADINAERMFKSESEAPGAMALMDTFLHDDWQRCKEACERNSTAKLNSLARRLSVQPIKQQQQSLQLQIPQRGMYMGFLSHTNTPLLSEASSFQGGPKSEAGVVTTSFRKKPLRRFVIHANFGWSTAPQRSRK